MWVVYWEWDDWEILITSNENFFINNPDCNESHWLVPGALIGSIGMTATISLHKYDEVVAENVRLRKGITDYLHGDYPRVKKTEQCKHSRYGFEGCENCIDDYFEQLLANH